MCRTPPSGTATPPGQSSRPWRRGYLRLLTWSFALFNAVRVASYLPTMWAIHASANSSQHSLWTWGAWLGANATMAAWLYEQNGQRADRAVLVNLANALACGATAALIAAYRP
ncbi:MAG: hypothetical protein HZC37_04105 [Burkholderiales bacterium]|nr:hypothetical protein [Burkholderiales bacterium]